MEEQVKSIATEEQITELGKKILDKMLEEHLEKLNGNFYDVLQEYLYEHHMNFKDSIIDEVFNLISDKWSKFTWKGDADTVRAKIYEANKQAIDKEITEQVVIQQISKFFGGYIGERETTSFRHSDLERKITEWIIQNNNKSVFKDLVSKDLTTHIECQDREIQNLRQTIDSIESEINNNH